MTREGDAYLPAPPGVHIVAMNMCASSSYSRHKVYRANANLIDWLLVFILGCQVHGASRLSRQRGPLATAKAHQLLQPPLD